MSKGCPNKCGRHIDDKQHFCSRKCFNEYHGQDPDTPVKKTMDMIGLSYETVD